ncbi:uncharacterized protein FIBRA_01775 [Fibroporia radiculosa]|uniref:Ketoreductase (KR) domain-containing protein n=1 Tax=Fibroporia radiculosa TaxID=599839 RepID=J4G163_9APHY|nr:uncharacterized protein FIBRA_01775 [Fibroporia radiculosa]CCL99753.1 predicted protein [Fibroporia radiculosa]
MPSYLITGASRGVGLAFVSELLQDPQSFVIATARNPNTQGLLELSKEYARDRLALVPMDVTNAESVNHAVTETEALLHSVGGGLDYLINNAGVALQELNTFDNVDLDILEQEFRVNSIAPLRVTRAFLPLVRKGQMKKVAFVSSDQASLELAPHFVGLAESYSLTKVALNMLGRSWGSTLRAEGITMILLHPGWVDTDMGVTIDTYMQEHQPNIKKITPHTSAAGCLRMVKEARLEDGVQFRKWDGGVIPW